VPSMQGRSRTYRARESAELAEQVYRSGDDGCCSFRLSHVESELIDGDKRVSEFVGLAHMNLLVVRVSAFAVECAVLSAEER
jgi:hypothetical protein